MKIKFNENSMKNSIHQSTEQLYTPLSFTQLLRGRGRERGDGKRESQEWTVRERREKKRERERESHLSCLNILLIRTILVFSSKGCRSVVLCRRSHHIPTILLRRPSVRLCWNACGSSFRFCWSVCHHHDGTSGREYVGTQRLKKMERRTGVVESA